MALPDPASNMPPASRPDTVSRADPGVKAARKRAAPSPPRWPPRPAGSEARPSASQRLGLLLLLVGGLAVRGLALLAAPDHAFLSDHVDYMAWSAHAWEYGPTSLYDLPAGSLINVRLPPWLVDPPIVTPYPAYSRCNYPPLSIYACWLQGGLWVAVDPQVICRQVLPEIAVEVGNQGGTVCSRVANTVKARLTNAALPIASDILLAAGVARLVRRLAPAGRADRLSQWAFGITFLAPPVFLNSAFWTQTDSWLACELVWVMYALLAGRHAVAGALYGAALLTKPQTLLFLPAVGWALLARDAAFGSRASRPRKAARFLGAVVVAVAVLAAPFIFTGAGGIEGGAFRWAYRGYIDPVLHDFPYTTLKAFNVWWLDFARREPLPEALAAQARIEGLTKDQVGRGLLLAALTISGWLCFRRFRWTAPGWPVFAFLVLFAAFVFPTRVHERYIYYSLPFLIASSLLLHRLLPALIVLLIVGTFEMTWNLWYAPAYAAPWDAANGAAAQAWSAVLALLSVGAYAWSTLALCRPTKVQLQSGSP